MNQVIKIYFSRSRDRDRRRRSRSRSRSRSPRDRRNWGGGGGGGRDRGGNSRGGRNQPGANLKRPRWDLSRLEPFKKDFYVPSDVVQDRDPRAVEQYRSDKEITLKGRNIPNPVFSFEEAGFPDYVLKEIRYVNHYLLLQNSYFACIPASVFLKDNLLEKLQIFFFFF